MHRMHKIFKLHRTNLAQKLTEMSVKMNVVEELMARAELPQMGRIVHLQLDTLRESSEIHMEGTRALHTSSTQDHTPQMEVTRQECIKRTSVHIP